MRDKLDIPGNKLSSAFGGAVGAHMVALRQGVKIPYQTSYNLGAYSAFAFDFAVAGNPSYTKGTHYDAVWTIVPAQFPNVVKLDWYVPQGTIPNPFGVWGYHHIDLANYDGNNPPTTTPSCTLGDLTDFHSTFDWSFTGSNDFGLLHELWLTKDKRAPGVGSSGDALFEIGFLLHQPSTTFHDSGTLIGTTHVNNGVTYTARAHGTYITFMKQGGGDVLSGTIDWKAALQFLMANEIITGSEWVNGIAFGIEPQAQAGTGTHGGQFVVTHLDMVMQGNTTAFDADYAGTNLVADANTMTNWPLAELTNGGAAADLNGGNTAVILLETVTNARHEFTKSGAFITVPSAQADYILIEDIKPDKGRTVFQHYVSASDFTNRFKTRFDTANMTVTSDEALGTTMARIGPAQGSGPAGGQIINLGNGWYRTISMFRKASGLTQIFLDFAIKKDATTDTYVGDVTKGVTMRPRHRLVKIK